MQALPRMTVQRDCGRLEWACLDWNAPSIAFYRALGAQGLTDWTTDRLAGDRLAQTTAAARGGPCIPPACRNKKEPHRRFFYLERKRQRTTACWQNRAIVAQA